MIRTHRPTGHHWTCASHFQQSKQYRNLDAESCEAPPSKVLYTTEEDRLTGAPRSAKRRKVETLANDFLEGKSLFISSACSNGSDLVETVNDVLKQRKLIWTELLDDHDENLWADGVDGWDALRKRGKKRLPTRLSRGHTKHSPGNLAPQCDESVPDVAAVSPKPFQSRLRPIISTVPSNEALKRAAELRAKKDSVPAEKGTRLDVPMLLAGHGTQSAPPTVRAPSSFKDPSSSRPYNPHTPAETTMADELRLSRTDSPSRRPRAFTLPAESFDSQATVEDTDDQNRLHSLADNFHAQCTAGASTTASAMGSCTGEQHEKLHNLVSSIDCTSTHRKQSQMPSSSVQKSTAEAQKSQNHQDINTRSQPRRNRSSSKAATRTSKRVSSRLQPTGSPQTSEKCSQKSSQSKLTRSFNASKSEYASTEEPQGGSTPFVCRKKVKGSKNAPRESPEPTSVQNYRETDPPPSEDTSATLRISNPATAPSVSAAPPTLDMSFQHDSSFAPNLNMALVDEHINRVLPPSPGPPRRSSSLKRSLRKEMRLSGADITRIPGELSSSPQRGRIESSAFVGYPETGEPSKSVNYEVGKRRSTGQWPGTQVLLSRAQEDLFISPEKLASGPAVAEETMLEAHTDFADTPDRGDARQPLQQMSQECLPATQALMDNWSPWSTAKKVKSSLQRKSNVHSPLVSRGDATAVDSERGSTKSSIKRPRLSQRAQKNLRRSSLRFSTMTAESPMPPQTATSKMDDGAGLAFQSTNIDTHIPSLNRANSRSPGSNHEEITHDDINLDLTAFSFAASDAFGTANVNDSMAEWNANDKMSSLQNAQRVNIDPHPEKTLADLATESLSTADIDGVLGGI